jgi:hypothetical protein
LLFINIVFFMIAYTIWVQKLLSLHMWRVTRLEKLHFIRKWTFLRWLNFRIQNGNLFRSYSTWLVLISIRHLFVIFLNLYNLLRFQIIMLLFLLLLLSVHIEDWSLLASSSFY